MGISDRLLRRRDLSVADESPPTTPKGGSGRFHTSGFLDFDEINANLRGRLGFEAFDKMWRTDADCRKALTMIVAAMVGGDLDIEKPGDDDTPTTEAEDYATRLVRHALFEEMRPKLPAHLWTALTVAGRCGPAPFEQVWKLSEFEGKPTWFVDTLDLRLPKSVDRWLQDGPRFAGVEQFTTVDGAGKIVKATIKARDLVYYRFGAEGDNWEGQSLLRPAYWNHKAKHAVELMQVMGLERTGLGVPTGWVPDGASPEDRDAFEEFLANMRASDVTYMLFPGPKATDNTQGWDWELKSLSSSAGDTRFKDALDYHSDKIAASVVEEFMRQGMKNVGTNATASTQQDPFLKLCEALVTIVVEDTINEQLIPRLVDLNVDGYPGTERYPKLSCSLIDSTSLTELATFVKTLHDAGAIRPEPRLEAFLRSRADLPEADEDAIQKLAEQEAAQAQADAQIAHAQALELTKEGAKAKAASKAPPGGKGAQLSLDDVVGRAQRILDDTEPYTVGGQRTLARQPRDLKPHEQHMSLDRIESAIDGARARFESAAGEHALALARDLAGQAKDGRVTPADAPEALVDAIASEMRSLYDTGRATVRDELMSQAMGHYRLDAMDRNDPAPSALDRLRARATAAADAIRAAIAQALHRTSLHKGTGPADLQLAAERAAGAALRGAAQDHAAAALNAGRSDQIEADSELIAGTYYTSILDGARCTHCASADDDVLRPLDDPVRLAHQPPNPDCQGGGRCRCMEAVRFKTEDAAAI